MTKTKLEELNLPDKFLFDEVMEDRETYEEVISILVEYEADHCTGMNVQEMTEGIYEYTLGYPYLVLAICLEDMYRKTLRNFETFN